MPLTGINYPTAMLRQKACYPARWLANATSASGTEQAIEGDAEFFLWVVEHRGATPCDMPVRPNQNRAGLSYAINRLPVAFGIIEIAAGSDQVGI
jgi:hypothetical protein